MDGINKGNEENEIADIVSERNNYKYGMLTAMLGGMLSYLVEPALAILAIMFGIFGIDKKENKKVRLLPFLGISLGVLGELLTLDLLYWHLVIKF